MHTAIDDGAGSFHQRLVRRPCVTIGLLVEVHPKHVWPAQIPRFGDQTLPAWMMTQNVSNHELAAQPFGCRNHAACILNTGRQRLFDEHVRTSLHRGNRVFGVAVGIGRDANQIGT